MAPEREKLVAGPGAGKPDSDFDRQALARGIEDELEEHGPDRKLAKKIAKDHLTLNRNAYPAKKKGKTMSKGMLEDLCDLVKSAEEQADLIKAEQLGLFHAPAGGGGGGAKKGEGSRGGHVIGHTKSGKPIYAEPGHSSHSSFTVEDHKDAEAAHREKAKQMFAEGVKQAEAKPDAKRRGMIDYSDVKEAMGPEKHAQAEAHRDAATHHMVEANKMTSQHPMLKESRERASESNDAREIREMKEGAKSHKEHVARANELHEMSQQFDRNSPHRYALHNAAQAHAHAASRSEGDGEGTYDAHSHSHDAQQYEKRPEVQAALAEHKKQAMGRAHELIGQKFGTSAEAVTAAKIANHQSLSDHYQQEAKRHRAYGGTALADLAENAAGQHLRAAGMHERKTFDAESVSRAVKGPDGAAAKYHANRDEWHTSEGRAHVAENQRLNDAPTTNVAVPGHGVVDVRSLHHQAAQANHEAAAAHRQAGREQTSKNAKHASNKERLADTASMTAEHGKQALETRSEAERYEASGHHPMNEGTPKGKQYLDVAQKYREAHAAHAQALSGHMALKGKLRGRAEKGLSEGALKAHRKAREAAEAANAPPKKLTAKKRPKVAADHKRLASLHMHHAQKAETDAAISNKPDRLKDAEKHHAAASAHWSAADAHAEGREDAGEATDKANDASASAGPLSYYRGDEHRHEVGHVKLKKSIQEDADMKAPTTLMKSMCDRFRQLSQAEPLSEPMIAGQLILDTTADEQLSKALGSASQVVIGQADPTIPELPMEPARQPADVQFPTGVVDRHNLEAQGGLPEWWEELDFGRPEVVIPPIVDGQYQVEETDPLVLEHQQREAARNRQLQS